MRLRFLLSALTLVIAGCAIGQQSHKDVALFKNDTGQAVVVYLSAEPGRYYAIFSLYPHDIGDAVLRPNALITVVERPPVQGTYVSIEPEGKEIAKVRLPIPAPSQTAPTRQSLLIHYRIVRGAVLLVPEERARDWPVYGKKRDR